LLLPAGSKLVITGEYDNSEHNAHLLAAAAQDPSGRCGPDKVVHFRDQNQTWDEMFSPIVEYSLARPAIRLPRAAAPDSVKVIEPDRAAVVGGREVRLVATAGCLVREAGGGWLLAKMGRLDDTRLQSTSTAEREALARLPSGALSMHLIGVHAFNPAGHAGERVAVKGAMIKDTNGTRLNVTSLQKVGRACAR
jgi:hypothetical protein